MKKIRKLSSLKNRSLAAAARRRTKLKNTLRKINNRKRALFNQTMVEQHTNAA